MWLDALALLILAGFAWSGARRGALAAGMALLTLLSAYAAAIVLGPILAPDVAGVFGVPEWLGIPIAGSVAFFGAFVIVAAVSALARRRDRVDDPRSARDRFLGAAFGVVRGACVVILLSYLALWLEALRVASPDAPVPQVTDSTAARATEEIVAAGVGAALAGSGPAGRVMARMASRPAVAIGDAMSLLEDPHFGALRSDAGFWADVEGGRVEAALDRRSFRELSNDDAVRGQLANLGLVDEAAAADPAAFRAAFGEVLEEVGPRLRALREDPALERLMEDPEVAAMVNNGDTLGLVSHPGFRELVARVAAHP